MMGVCGWPTTLLFALLSFVLLSSHSFRVNRYRQLPPPLSPLFSSATASSAADDFGRMKDYFVNPDDSIFEWYDMSGCNVVVPMNIRVPSSIIHFIGGFLAGSAVKASYQSLLEELASKGHLVVATPLPPFERDHGRLAVELESKFGACYVNDLLPMIGKAAIQDVPIVGLGHSLGGKLTALIDCKSSSSSSNTQAYKKLCNIYMAFNNYGVTDNLQQVREMSDQLSPEVRRLVDTVANAPEIANLMEIAKKEGFASGVQKTISNSLERALGSNNPLVDNIVGQVKEATSNLNLDALEFTPSPEQTWNTVIKDYSVRQNYIIKFSDDSIDQSMALIDVFSRRGSTSRVLRLPGTHITPLGRPNTDPLIDPNFVRRLTRILGNVTDKECDFDFSPMGISNTRYMIDGAHSGGDSEHDNF